MICLGIDPDLHNTGIALISSDGVIDLDIISITKTKKGEEDEAVSNMILSIAKELSPFIGLVEVDLSVIEGQQKYFGTSNARVEDILRLAHITGAAAVCSATRILIPKPAIWKGTIPKEVHQERILNKLGWNPKKTTTHSYPKNPPKDYKHFTSEQWKHIVDAMGLAMWGLKFLSLNP